LPTSLATITSPPIIARELAGDGKAEPGAAETLRQPRRTDHEDAGAGVWQLRNEPKN
jgi:hypothetical protein